MSNNTKDSKTNNRQRGKKLTKKELQRRKKNQRIRLFIRRVVFLIIFLALTGIVLFFVINGASTFFRGEGKDISTEADKDTNKALNTEKDMDSKEESMAEKDNDSTEASTKEENIDSTEASAKEDIDSTEVVLDIEKEIKAGTIYEGIHLDELDVSGMKYDEAVDAYSKYLDDSLKRGITFKDSLGSYDTTFRVLGVKVDVDKAVMDALTFGRTGNILERYKEIEMLKSDNVTIVPEKTFDKNKLSDLLSTEADKLVKAPVNSSMVRSDGQFIVYESEKGLDIDYDKTASLVEKELEKKWESKAVTIMAATKEIEPEYTEDDFYGVDTLLGRCVTEYNVKNSERIANLEVGAHKIADSVLLPGQQFSVYNTVAPFTEENGYHNAGQYINAELVDGLGGGICQVATTLYGAVLESELQVDERYPHSMIVSYVKKGMDAAIAEGYQDFKFTNNTGYPIYIDAYAGGGYVSVAIYGHETRSPGRRIEFESQEIETYKPGEERTIYDDTLPSGTTNVTEAHTGYYVEVWKHIYQDGELIDSVKINGSEYQAVPKTTRIGTMTQ